MKRARLAALLTAVVLLAGCAGFQAGSEFPSPDPRTIVVGKSHKAYLERVFGPPYEVGADPADPTWTRFYGRTGGGPDRSKSLTVRFNSDGTVKSCSFSSNFPRTRSGSSSREEVMPDITTRWYADRTNQKKPELAAAITEAMVRIGKTTPDQVHIVFRDVEKSNWGGRRQAGERPLRRLEP